MKEYHVGIYARLSRDDERQGESVSIENQKLLLRRYCDRQGWTVVGEYVDDGWSGTNFDRPAFRRLLEDVEQKKVNLVLVKDLSRGQAPPCHRPACGRSGPPHLCPAPKWPFRAGRGGRAEPQPCPASAGICLGGGWEVVDAGADLEPRNGAFHSGQ